MSTRSKFERQLAFRLLGFSIKIPDAGVSLKPFDYVVGVPVKIDGIHSVRFVAIEAKTARGWTMPSSYMLPHQIKALDAVDKLACNSSWVAIGFLDLPKMKRGYDGKKLYSQYKREAFLLPWSIVKKVMGETSLRYADIASSDYLMSFAMEYKKIRSAYRWIVQDDHPIHELIIA